MPVTVFDVVGGDYFIDLVEDFYRRVDVDPVLRPSYPDDLSESKRTLAWFLIQYWGGPTDYSDERGHPRLRMRHVPFVITQVERDAWLRHMTDAVAASPAPVEVRQLLDSYFQQASTAMINRPL
ncbi:MAG: globin [Actinomycetota bacterium]